MKDVINFMANDAGGVHVGNPKKAKQQSLMLISFGVTASGRPFASELLRIIIKIVLKSLGGLYLIIKQNHID